MESLDHASNLPALSCLPETIKRNILSRLIVVEAAKTSEQPAVVGADAADSAVHAPSVIAGRHVQLPLMCAGAAVVDNVLSVSEVQAVASAVEAWLSQHGRRPGMGSQTSGGLWQDSAYRGDINCWVNPAELQDAGQPLLAACLQMLAGLRTQLSEQGYDVSGRCSCQLACYPGKGARYVRHTDASESAPDRSITALLYLNPMWDVQADGGQLALYNAAHSKYSPHSQIALASGPSSQAPSSASLSLSNPSQPQETAGVAAAAAAAARDADAADDLQLPAGHLAGEPALLVAPTGGRLLVFDSRLPHEVLPAHKTRLSITAWFYRSKAEPSLAAAPSALAQSCPQTAAPAAADAGAVSHISSAAATASTVADISIATCPAVHAAEAHDCAAGSAPTEVSVAAAVQDSNDSPTAVPVACTATSVDCIGTTHPAEDLGRGPASAPTAATLPRIFVSIAAFRDEECQWTLRDLFLKAAHPQRVFVGVAWQIDPVADAHFVRIAGGSRTAPFLPQVREVRCHYTTATGPCAARSMAQQLWAGEEYLLQLDAHMRFVQGWDDLCITELQAAQQAAGHESVVLSTYPLGYDGQGTAAAVPEAAPTTLLCAKEFDASGLLRVQSRCLRERPAAPVPSHFWAAGFSFAPSAWLVDVPYCPHLPHVFFGEEQYMLLRMWTRGWDVFAPTQPVVFHQWERSARPSSYQACIKLVATARATSQQRVLSVCQSDDGGKVHEQQVPSAKLGSVAWHRATSPTDDDWAVGGVWGLGTARTLHMYEQRAGVSFKDRTMQQHSVYGGQSPDIFEA